MLTASLILAALAAGATAVIYGTDAFCALVWSPSLAGLDDSALARSAGAVHRYGDARLPPIGATGIVAATASAVSAALAGHPGGTALAGAAVLALLAWLALYLRVYAPVNRTLIRARTGRPRAAACLADRSRLALMPRTSAPRSSRVIA